MQPAAGPLNFTTAMFRLCDDISRRVDVFHHIRMSRVAVSFAQTRSRVQHGLQAKLTPMRFKDGSLTTRRNGQLWTVERLYSGDVEILYILTFYLPRFLNHSFREKLITVFHELYHVSPAFDGDIRRLPGRYHVHSGSQEAYDREMEVQVDRYLARRPPRSVLQFLRSRYSTLCRQHGGVVGLQVPIPRLVAIPDSRSA